MAHVSLYESRVDASGILPHYLFGIGGSGVDLFFVISGFVMFTISGDGTNGLNSARSFLIHRIARIYPLYWIFTLLVLTILLINPHMINRAGGMGDFSVIRSFFLIPDVGKAPLVGQGWTLVHEMYFYLVFACVVLARSKMRIYLILGWALAVAAFNWVLNAPNSPCWNIATHPSTFEFIFGCFIAFMLKKGLNSYGIIALVIGCLLLHLGANSLENRRVLWTGASALIVYGAAAVENKHSIIFPLWLRNVGNMSYSLYISHILVLSACLKVWKSYSYSGPYDNAVACVVMVALALGTSFYVYRYVEYPIMNISKRMLKRGTIENLVGKSL